MDEEQNRAMRKKAIEKKAIQRLRSAVYTKARASAVDKLIERHMKEWVQIFDAEKKAFGYNTKRFAEREKVSSAWRCFFKRVFNRET